MNHTHETKGPSSFSSSPTLMPTSLAIENAPLRIADWLSEYTHHFQHAHHSQLPVQPALKVIFPKKPQISISTSNSNVEGTLISFY